LSLEVVISVKFGGLNWNLSTVGLISSVRKSQLFGSFPRRCWEDCSLYLSDWPRGV